MNLISVGVSVFIVYLLLCYIRNMLKECKEAGRGRICRAVFLMFLVFAMSFVISSVEILALFFLPYFLQEEIIKNKSAVFDGNYGCLYHVSWKRHASGWFQMAYSDRYRNVTAWQLWYDPEYSRYRISWKKTGK